MIPASPKISVIVPVYNAVTVLHRCVASILAQVYADFELLLIDDGSSDGSGDICDAYAAKLDKVKTFHQPNSGVSMARNKGLDEAAGEYICFVDADDWIDPNYLEAFFRYGPPARDCLSIINIEEHTPASVRKIYSLYDRFYTGTVDFSTAMNDIIFRLPAPFAKLFIRDVIESAGLRFYKGIHSGEDVLFILGYLRQTEAISYVSGSCYHYMRMSSGSLSAKINGFDSEYYCLERMKDDFGALLERYYVKEHYERYCGYAVYRTLRSIYMNEYGRGFQGRLSLLKKVYTRENVRLLRSHARLHPRRSNNIAVSLYKFRLWHLYDFYMVSFMRIKYSAAMPVSGPKPDAGQ